MEWNAALIHVSPLPSMAQWLTRAANSFILAFLPFPLFFSLSSFVTQSREVHTYLFSGLDSDISKRNSRRSLRLGLCMKMSLFFFWEALLSCYRHSTCTHVLAQIRHVASRVRDALLLCLCLCFVDICFHINIFVLCFALHCEPGFLLDRTRNIESHVHASEFFPS